jgi:hypothetical protein
MLSRSFAGYIKVRPHMFRYLYFRSLARSLRGLPETQRDEILKSFSKISGWEAFELLFMPGRKLGSVAEEEPSVLHSVQQALAASTRTDIRKQRQ